MTSEERREGRYLRRKAKRDAARMQRSYDCGDFDEVFSFRHLYLSAKQCAKGVGWKNSTQRYIGNLIPNVAKTYDALKNERFKRRGFHEFTLMERGKKRRIRSVHISERVVQKCLCDYCIVPIYTASFIYDNSASTKCRGMDFAIRRMRYHLEEHVRKHGLTGGVLLYDLHGYFDNAPHEPLFREAERRIHDEKIRRLLRGFIDDFGSVGLGLGSQVSQVNALLLLSPIDHYFKEQLQIKAYSRYMDDGIAIHHSIEHLHYCLDRLKVFCNEIGVELNEKKTRIVPLTSFFRFLKIRFIITDQNKIILKMNRAATTRIRRKLRSFKKLVAAGEMSLSDVRASYESYQGCIKRGNSFKVRQSTNQYFKSLFGFYPNKKGWKKYV